MGTPCGRRVPTTSPASALDLLRQKLGDTPGESQIIRTLPGVGYRFDADEQRTTASAAIP